MSIRSRDGKHYPILTCDKCRKPIDDSTNALVVFSHKQKGTDFSSVEGIFHKGSCDPGHHRSIPYWQQLDRYIPWLLWNNQFGQRLIEGNKLRIIIDVPEPPDFI
jgi:hypothetical protein